jgi:heme oxygenase (mycobilin-producing)
MTLDLQPIDSRSQEPTEPMTSAILINPFEVPDDVGDDEFLAGWDEAAAFLRDQPGFIGSRLHRSVGPDARFRYINVAEWETPESFRAAVSSETFRRMAADVTTPNFPALYAVVRTVGGTDAGQKETQS